MATTKKSTKKKSKVKKVITPVEHSKDFFDFDAAEGASLVSGDISGYWDPEVSAIRAIPRSVKLFDGDIESDKVAALVIAELTKPNKLKVKNDEGEWELVTFPAGTMAGIWYKPGMRGIVKKAGTDCYIKYVAEQDTGKPNPMKVFEVKAPQGGIRIPILEDTREDSADKLTDFHDKKPKKKKLNTITEEEVEDDEFEGDDEDDDAEE